MIPQRRFARLLPVAALAFCGCGGFTPDFGRMAGGRAAGPPATWAESPILMHRTPNNLTVLAQQAPGVGVATLDMWVRAGSANEPADIDGVSHFLEHMLFKGTDQYGPGEMDLLVEGLGGVLNAGTWKDWTHYYMTVPADNTLEAMKALADSVLASRLDAAELEKERLVIVEEILRKQDNPHGLLYELIYQTAFSAGPYRSSVLGRRETIETLPRSAMLDYYNRHYTPDNMTLVAVGDFDPERLIAETDRLFGGSSESARPYDSLPFDSRWSAGGRVTLERDVQEIYAADAWPAPSISLPRAAVAADLLETALTNGRASRLYRTLKERRQVATSIGAFYPSHRHDSLFVVSATVEPAKIEAYEAALAEELAQVCDSGFTADELNRAKRLLINAFHFSQETTSGAAAAIGHCYTLTGSLDFMRQYVALVESLTGDEVREVARRIFLPEYAARVRLVPKSSSSK